MSVISELALHVAELRADVANRTTHLADLKAAWEAEHQPLIDELHEARDELKAAESELRRIVEEAHYETGEKSFPLGIKVRSVTKIAYDEHKARTFAAKYRPELLVLDKKAFEKLVRSNTSDLGNPEWVQVAAVAQATLPANMNGGAE